ncbi:PEP-CTERM sorting domain-containing protein [Pacificimonas sp. WHA3]|uniref:PEP-CTERM sorting domain-containing protein n=1 Tax=Pacificimonas pallii TaxID=2827236 RepID=A0ABS6SGX9_9SPHN|nr:PEP-CTERM sorting domain-containing protein [Pacificimonas pallii]MBV7257146.1 PEP-CTERM sorting domain-containing protein [Pacificimonas pallii]
MYRLLPLAAAACISLPALAAPFGPVIVNVEGDNNPFLAGQPDGATALGDTAPGQSPTEAPFSVVGLEFLQFDAIGGFNFGGGAPSPTADGNSAVGTADMRPSAGTGISGAQNIAFNALVGVFVGSGVPTDPAPDPIDFGGDLAFLSLTPDLNQIFYIGDGLTGLGTGDRQTFFVPVGATRLFLGSSDGFGWFNNSGVSVVTITGETRDIIDPPGPVPAPGALGLLGLGIMAMALRRRRG